MSEPLVIEAAEQISEILSDLGENRRHEKHAFLRIQEAVQKVVQDRSLDETYSNVMAVADEIGGFCVPNCPFAGTKERSKLSDDLSLRVFYARAIAVGILNPFVHFGEGVRQSGAKRLDSYLENKGMFPKDVRY